MADPETTAAFDRIATLVSDSNEDSRRRSRELHEKIDANQTVLQESSRLMGLELQRTTTAFDGHVTQDDKDFKDIRKRLDSHDGRWWKLLGVSGAGGGIIAGIVQAFTGKGHP